MNKEIQLYYCVFTQNQGNFSNSYHSNSNNPSRRTSINVSEISVPIVDEPLRNSVRRSFRATETNDIVPKFKTIRPNEEISTKKNFAAVEDESSSSSDTLSSTLSSSTDSTTPSSFSVILLLETGHQVDNDENGIKSKEIIRNSKKFYAKSNVKLVGLKFSSLDSLSALSEGSILTMKEDDEVLGNALNVLKKFNYDRLFQNNDTSKGKLRLSLKSLEVNSLNPKKEEERLSPEMPIEDFIIPEHFWINRSSTSSDDNEDIIPISPVISFKSKRLSSLKSDFLEEFPNSDGVKGSEEILENQLPNQDDDEVFYRNTKENIDQRVEIKILSPTNLSYTDRHVEAELNNKNSQQPLLKEPKPDSIISKIQSVKKYDMNKVLPSNFMPPKRSREKSQGLLTKEMIEANRSFVYPYKTVGCNKMTKETISLRELLINSDIIVIGKSFILNLNDIPVAIAKTVILRELGLLTISESVLIREAIKIVKSKSENLKLNFVQKFPILQKAICRMINKQKNNGHYKIHSDKTMKPISEMNLKGISYILNMNYLIEDFKVSNAKDKQNENYVSITNVQPVPVESKINKKKSLNPHKKWVEINMKYLRKRFH